MHTRLCRFMKGQKNHLQEVLSSHFVCSGAQIQEVTLGSEHLYLRASLWPRLFFLCLKRKNDQQPHCNVFKSVFLGDTHGGARNTRLGTLYKMIYCKTWGNPIFLERFSTTVPNKIKRKAIRFSAQYSFSSSYSLVLKYLLEFPLL